MVSITKWNPSGSLMHGFFGNDLDFVPRLDIKDTEDELVITLDIPGVDRDNVDVSVEKHILIISGEKKGEAREGGTGYTYYERSLGRFERRLRRPDNVDISRFRAAYKDGVLTLQAPKTRAARPTVKRVAVK